MATHKCTQMASHTAPATVKEHVQRSYLVVLLHAAQPPLAENLHQQFPEIKNGMLNVECRAILVGHDDVQVIRDKQGYTGCSIYAQCHEQSYIL